MGCFLACFGGDGDRSRRKLRRQSPARSPPRPNHVAVVRVASVAADLVVRERSPPLRGAKVSKSPLAVEAPDEVVRRAPAADVVAREASLPLHGVGASKPPSAVVATDGVVGEASDRAVVNKALLPSHEAEASMAPPAVRVANDMVTSASPCKELRELSEQEAPSVGSLLPEKKDTPPVSSVKCSPMMVASICTQDSLEFSPGVAAVVSAPNSELRELSDHGSRNSGKKKVTFNMNVATYENAAAPDQEEGYAEDEDENHAQKPAELPESHRYRNCSDSDDDVGDEYADYYVYGDDSDEEDDYMDCKIDLLDEEEMNSEENKQESYESLFSLPLSNDQQNDDEVVSPAPKSSGTSVEKESPLIKGSNLFGRSKCVRPVLNPVQNLAEWEEVKSLKTQHVPSTRFVKENVDVVQDVGTSISDFANQTKVGACNSSKKDDEVVSAAPRSSGTSVEKESPLIKRSNLLGRSKCVRPVLNPVQNLAEWEEVKSLKTQQVPSTRFDKENVDVVQDVGASIYDFANQTKMGASSSSKKEVSVDASLSTWLASSNNSTVDKVQSKSPCSTSSVSQDERSAALIIDDLKKSSATSPSHNHEGAPILGTVGSYWSCTKQCNDYCPSRSDSGTNGIPNTTSKYREDKRVNWHSTPFNVRLDRALKNTSA